MKRYLFLSFFIFTALAFGIFSLLKAKGELMPPYITSRPSFNAKIQFIKDHPPQNIHTAIIGNSMALNNLWASKLGTLSGKSTYNFSSWGLTPGQLEFWAQTVIERYSPKRIILSIQPTGFTQADSNFFWKPLMGFHLDTRQDFLVHLMSGFDLVKKITKRKEYLQNIGADNIYSSLKFDRFGSVPLSSENFQYKKHLWNKVFKPHLIEQASYSHIKELVNQYPVIEFYFVQAPFKEGYITDKEALNKHLAHLKKMRLNLLDFSGESWSDAHFVDTNHLNKRGAERLTRLVFENLIKQ